MSTINNADKARYDFMQKQMTKVTTGIVSNDIPYERFKATSLSEVQGKHETTVEMICSEMRYLNLLNASGQWAPPPPKIVFQIALLFNPGTYNYFIIIVKL